MPGTSLRWIDAGRVTAALGVFGALASTACNPLPEGHSLLNPPTATCDLVLSRSQDCVQVNGRFSMGQCTVAPASVCHGPDGTAVVIFLSNGGTRHATVSGRATCRSGPPVPDCAPTE